MTNTTKKVDSLVSKLHQRWRDPAMAVLLIVQCITVFCLIPATAFKSAVPAGIVGVLPLLFSSLVIFVTQLESAIAIGVIALVMSGAVLALGFFQQRPPIEVSEEALSITTFLLLTTAVFVTVFAPGPFSAYRALGSIVIYLNVGLLFALIYRVVALLSANAFAGLVSSSDQSSLRAALEYFSFSTLTSVGYGDITPISPIARGFAIFEAAIGQLFPATILARAVTRAMHARGE